VTLRLATLIPVWVLVVVGIVLVVTIATPSGYFRWFSIVLASAVLITFIIQLALRSKEGLVIRIMASLGGAVVLLVVATVILLPIVAR
jgi:hypothetical protein